MEYITICILIFILGITIGSFLNVCIYRIPAREDIISKRSRCNHCGSVLKWYELIPLVSFLLQGGNCRSCGKRLSLQYPLIELANGVFYVWVFMVKGFSLESLLFGLCGSVLLVVSVIDARTYEIPFGCNCFIFFLGLIRLLTDLPHWYLYITGFFIVSGFFYLLYVLTKGRGIGGGDVKLMAAAGLLLGMADIILAMVIGCMAGSIIHLGRMRFGGKERTLAFGPYLSIGIAAAMLYGNGIIKWYLGFF